MNFVELMKTIPVQGWPTEDRQDKAIETGGIGSFVDDDLFTRSDLENQVAMYCNWSAENPIYKTDRIERNGECEPFQVPIPRPLTVHAFCIFLGIHTDVWNGWKESRPDLEEIIARAELMFFVQRYECAVVGLFNADLMMLELQLEEEALPKTEANSIRLMLDELYLLAASRDNGKN